jgi:hypothetical protein
MQHGTIPIMIAAALEHRELVEILFTRTKPIASLPNWSIDGIINTMKHLPLKAQVSNFFLFNFLHDLLELINCSMFSNLDYTVINCVYHTIEQ